MKISYGVQPERIGKKIAIRRAFLLPMYSFEKLHCGMEARCDFYETAGLYVEVQSIWPEPVLLTAAHLERTGFKSESSREPATMGKGVLAERITRQWNPQEFLLQPGETKLVGMERGLRLEGLMEFFTDDLRGDFISCDLAPCVLHNSQRVDELNSFFAVRYGKRASLRLTIYEKDYVPILKTSFRLSDGDNLFSVGNVRNDAYRLQHDALIAEALYVLQGGTDTFGARLDAGGRRKTSSDEAEAGERR